MNHFMLPDSQGPDGAQGGGRYGLRDLPRCFFRSEVAAKIDEIVRYPRGSAGASGDFLRAARVDGDLEESTTAQHNALESGAVIIIEPRIQGETRTQGRGQQARTGRGADEGKFWNGKADAAGVGPLVDHDIEPKILHRTVKILFHRFWDTVNFIDKQNIAFLQVGEQAGQIAGFFNDWP